MTTLFLLPKGPDSTYACLLENQTPRTEQTRPCALCTCLCQTLHVVLGTYTKGGHQNSGVTSEWQAPWWGCGKEGEGRTEAGLTP